MFFDTNISVPYRIYDSPQIESQLWKIFSKSPNSIKTKLDFTENLINSTPDKPTPLYQGPHNQELKEANSIMNEFILIAESVDIEINSELTNLENKFQTTHIDTDTSTNTNSGSDIDSDTNNDSGSDIDSDTDSDIGSNIDNDSGNDIDNDDDDSSQPESKSTKERNEIQNKNDDFNQLLSTGNKLRKKYVELGLYEVSETGQKAQVLPLPLEYSIPGYKPLEYSIPEYDASVVSSNGLSNLTEGTLDYTDEDFDKWFESTNAKEKYIYLWSLAFKNIINEDHESYDEIIKVQQDIQFALERELERIALIPDHEFIAPGDEDEDSITEEEEKMTKVEYIEYLKSHSNDVSYLDIFYNFDEPLESGIQVVVLEEMSRVLKSSRKINDPWYRQKYTIDKCVKHLESIYMKSVVRETIEDLNYTDIEFLSFEYYERLQRIAIQVLLNAQLNTFEILELIKFAKDLDYTNPRDSASFEAQGQILQKLANLRGINVDDLRVIEAPEDEEEDEEAKLAREKENKNRFEVEELAEITLLTKCLQQGYHSSKDQVRKIVQNQLYYDGHGEPIENNMENLQLISTICTKVYILIFLFIPLYLIAWLAPKYSESDETKKRRKETKVSPLAKTKKLSDVVGIDQILSDLEDLVKSFQFIDIFANTRRYQPKGFLFTGPPGTGKTLLAKALAGEANFSFFYASASYFKSSQKGRGLELLRTIFKHAQHEDKSIIFIDEVDILGQKRKLNPNSYLEYTGKKEDNLDLLTEFLTLLDGFIKRRNVLIIGSTNLPEQLDSALIRPGRFDRIYQFELPGFEIRQQLLKQYAEKFFPTNLSKPQWEFLSKRALGFNGADLAAITNESLLKVVREKKTTHTFETFKHGFDRITTFSQNIDPNDEFLKVRSAYYQAGIGIIQLYLQDCYLDVLELFPRRQNFRFTQKITRPAIEAIEVNQSFSTLEIKNQIWHSLAGFATDLFVFSSLKPSLFDLALSDFQTLESIINLKNATVLTNCLVRTHNTDRAFVVFDSLRPTNLHIARNRTSPYDLGEDPKTYNTLFENEQYYLNEGKEQFGTAVDANSEVQIVELKPGDEGFKSETDAPDEKLKLDPAFQAMLEFGIDPNTDYQKKLALFINNAIIDVNVEDKRILDQLYVGDTEDTIKRPLDFISRYTHKNNLLNNAKAIRERNLTLQLKLMKVVKTLILILQDHRDEIDLIAEILVRQKKISLVELEQKITIKYNFSEKLSNSEY